MAELSGLDMVREIIGQINNLRRLVTINGKKFKWDGKKYVRAVDGKTFTKKELTSYVKDQNFRAPGTDRPSKDTSRPRKPSEELKTTKITKDSKGRRVVDPEGNKLKIKRQDIKGDIKNKAKSVTSNIKKTTGQTVNKGNQVLQNLKLRVGQPNADSITTRGLKINKYLRGLKPTTLAGSLGKGGATWGLGMLGDLAADQIVDRTSRAIAGKNKMSLEDYRTARDRGDFKGTLRNKLGIKPTYDRPQPTVTRNNRGRVIDTQQPVGRNWQDPYMGPPQPEIETTPPNLGTDNSEKTKEAKNNKSTVGKVMGDYAGSYNETKKKKKKNKKNNTLMINGKKPSAIQKKLLKAGFTTKQLGDLVDAYDEKYRNKRGW